VHTVIIGEHKAKVNGNLQFLRLGTSSIARSGGAEQCNPFRDRKPFGLGLTVHLFVYTIK